MSANEKEIETRILENCRMLNKAIAARHGRLKAEARSPR